MQVLPGLPEGRAGPPERGPGLAKQGAGALMEGHGSPLDPPLEPRVIFRNSGGSTGVLTVELAAREGRKTMAPQDLEQHPEAKQPYAGPLAEIPSLGFATRRRRSQGSGAWRETVTQHAPEPWLAARLGLQARIAALD